MIVSLRTCAGLGLIALAACGGPSVTRSLMIQAPNRQANCDLELVEVDITSVSFNQEWDVIGHIIVDDPESALPTAPANRALVRPHACDMGGYAIAVGMDVATGGMGSSQVLTYLVLRKKSDVVPPPQKF